MSAPPLPAAASSLSVRDVSKAYRAADGATVLVLDRVSLEIAAGEFVALVGPSGCGKSTLLRLLAGLEPSTTGQLLIGDEPILRAGAERGLVFQDPSLFPWLTVRGNIRSGLIARKVLRQFAHEVDEFIRLMSLENFADAYPHQLSGGMAQRCSLARALVNHPRVMLMDEPLGALDAFTRMRLQDEVLRMWKSRGTTNVLVTHDIDEALYMTDRMYIMSPRPGRIEHVYQVPLPRPRHRNDPQFLKLRGEILTMLHFEGNAGGEPTNEPAPPPSTRLAKSGRS